CGGNCEGGPHQPFPRGKKGGGGRLEIGRRVPVELGLARTPLFLFFPPVGGALSPFSLLFFPQKFSRLLAPSNTAKSPRARRTPLPRRRGAAALKLLDPSREDQPGRIEPDRYALAGGFLSACGRILERRLARGLDGQGIGAQFDFQAQIGVVVF